MIPYSRNEASILFTQAKAARVLGGILLCPLLACAGPAVSGNPYRQIAERNVFGLRPPSPRHVELPPAPLPKVVLTGITTILGKKRALLKIQFPAKPAKPPKQVSCILTEGQRDGPVEVLEINEKTSQVKVANSGTISLITFEKATPTPPPVAKPQPRLYLPRLPAQAAYRKY